MNSRKRLNRCPRCGSKSLMVKIWPPEPRGTLVRCIVCRREWHEKEMKIKKPAKRRNKEATSRKRKRRS